MRLLCPEIWLNSVTAIFKEMVYGRVVVVSQEVMRARQAKKNKGGLFPAHRRFLRSRALARRASDATWKKKLAPGLPDFKMNASDILLGKVPSRRKLQYSSAVESALCPDRVTLLLVCAHICVFTVTSSNCKVKITGSYDFLFTLG